MNNEEEVVKDLNKRKDSKIVLLINRVTNGPLEVNDSFNLRHDSMPMRSSVLMDSSKNSSNVNRVSNNTSLQKLIVSVDQANSFHLES